MISPIVDNQAMSNSLLERFQTNDFNKRKLWYVVSNYGDIPKNTLFFGAFPAGMRNCISSNLQEESIAIPEKTYLSIYQNKEHNGIQNALY